MDKKDVAHLLDQIAAFLELKGENPFRIRAYHTAARAITNFQGDLHAAVESGELADLAGVGPATLEIVKEAVNSGRAARLDALRKEIPPGLVEMMSISGLGVTKIRQIHESLGIDTLAELEEAAQDGRLARLPRFGDRTAKKILTGLQFLKQVSQFTLLPHAREESERLAKALSELPGVQSVELAGSVRRGRELIRDLDFLVEVDEPGEVLADRLGNLVGIREFVGNAPGAFTLRFASNAVADVYTCVSISKGFQWIRATGSKEHIEGLVQRAGALGLEWTDACLKRDGTPVPCSTEEEVYRALDMQFISPELREGLGEIEAAIQRTLPALVTPQDIRGFLHCHTNYSDGTSTLREWAVAGLEHGYEYVGITDHSAAATYAGGLYAQSIDEQHAEIDQVNREVEGVTVLKGVEVDILENGDLDYDADVRARFDFIIASIHNRFRQSAEQMTRRILKAMDDPHMVILGHPTGRLLLSRDPYPMDLDAIFAKAKQRGIAIEINAHPQRLDLDWREARRAAAMGVLISIGADAHNTSGMNNMNAGVGMARKAWLAPHQVLNSLPLSDFLTYARSRK